MKIPRPSEKLRDLDRLIRKYQFAIDHENEGVKIRALEREKSKMEQRKRIVVNSVKSELKGLLND